ncbi:hypothetical protein SUDANB121_02878 [Nocardiopsis dassonvillei]|uniref:TAXI family TRAP transporter solute-binding subunit n=1 Tax=Nocardiopsis dassonvillei TaxID=2014 RepID=UPI003F554724
MGPDRRSVLLGALGAAAGAVLAGCARGSGAHVPELVIATGPPGAVFREIGAEIAVLVRERLPATEVTTVDTNASHDNLYLLEDGNAHLGLSSLDSTLTHEAEIAEGGTLSAVGRLYDSFVHLVVPDGSPVRALADLAGLRVSVGSEDSGTEFTARQLLREAGLSADTVLMDQASSARALADGEIDAMFSLTGLPTPAIAGLARERDVRLIDLSEAAGTMADAHPESYFQATIPATTYHGVPACPTLSTPNLLLCRTDLPDGLVFEVTDTVYRGASRLAAQRPEAAQINVRTGISTGVVPLHPGAVRWYRENKPS